MREILGRLKYYAAVVLFLLTSSVLSVGPALPVAHADNNGTLKVHEIGTPSGTESNDPKVCAFNFEGFSFDSNQSGYINIDGQGQTTTNYDGQYPFGPTDVNGYAISQDFNNGAGTVLIANGQYKATLYGKDAAGNVDLTDVKAKSKVFKVDCGVSAVVPTLDTQVSSGAVNVGDSVTDTATFTPTQANGDVTGTVDFFVCGPEQSNPDCTTGGTQVGGDATISSNTAISGSFVPTQPGNYCFRADYTPDGYANYLATSHTNQTTECFTATQPTGTITVTKVVHNYHGGTAKAADFPLYVSGTQVTSGTTNTFNAGQGYTVSENGGPSGYQQVGPTICTDGYGTSLGASFTLDNGENVSCTITNEDIAPQLTVIKKVVNQYGGTADASDFTMYVTGTNVSNSSFPGSSLGTTVTLNAGSYSVSESSLNGYIGSYSGDCNGTIALGDTKTCTITNSDTPASISGTKYEVNANGAQVGNTGLSGWTIELYDSNNKLVGTQVTDANGNYSFTNLYGGTSYTLLEVLQNGWTQIVHPGTVTTVMGQSSTGADFGNFQNATIKGYKWNDVNGDGKHQHGEAKLSGWTIELYDHAGTLIGTKVTDVNGNYEFTDIAPGKYKVCEVMQTGWVQTYPVKNNGCHPLTVKLSGSTFSNENFGNQQQGGGETQPKNPTITVTPGPCVATVLPTGTATVTITNPNNFSVDYLVDLGSQEQMITVGGGQTGQVTFTGLAAGTYSVVVRGDDDTMHATGSVTIVTCPVTPPSNGGGGGHVLGASTTVTPAATSKVAELANTGTSVIVPTILAISMALTATGVMLGDYMRRKSAASDPTL